MLGREGMDGENLMPRIQLPAVKSKRRSRNRGRLVGPKRPLLPERVWAIRARLEFSGNPRDLALFNSAIDSKLRDCDPVRLKAADLIFGRAVHSLPAPASISR